MLVFLLGAVLFIISFVIHVAAWNVRCPRREATALFCVFLLVGLVGFVGSYFIIGGNVLRPFQFALAIVLYSSFCLFYFLLFSAVESDSPTLTLISIIRKSGSRGISREQLMKQSSTRSFVHNRLQQMIRDGFLRQVNDRLYPGPRGRVLARLVLSYRYFLGEREAGG